MINLSSLLRRTFCAVRFQSITQLVTEFENEKNLDVGKVSDYMKGWMESQILETQLKMYSPNLDELKKQSKTYINDISSSEQLENYIAFYSAFSEDIERSFWQKLTNKTLDLLKEIPSEEIIFIFTALDKQQCCTHEQQDKFIEELKS